MNVGRTQRAREKKKDEKRKGKKTKEAPAPVRQAGWRTWGKGILMLLAAAVLQALVGLAMLQSKGEAESTEDFLVTGGVAGPLAVFADPDAPCVVETQDSGGRISVLDPGDLAVLVISSGRKVWLLRATLQSLSRVDGLRPGNVLVSLGSWSSQAAVQEFGFPCAGFETTQKGGEKKCMPIFQEAAVPNVHLNRSLHLALTHFRGKGLRSLVVLEEGQIFSLDLLWFFVQLLPVIRRDSSILCASAWNENGLAPGKLSV
ncbi:unnamed protein product [Durusdinium trenchii]|uniref:Uncharacterized protein n=1 Tax=Durusdinium trenchii TaxID=1381693 RepID=A0ABP0LIY7_9DINO